MSTNYTPRDVFLAADNVRISALILQGVMTQSRDYRPVVTSSFLWAFSFELHLKCLVLIDTGTAPPNLHDLRKLFDLLKPATRAGLRAEYKKWVEHFRDEIERERAAMVARGAPWPDYHKFDEVLDKSKDAFVNFRYIYDRTSNTANHIAGLIDVVRSRILDLHPDWVGAPPPLRD